MLTKSYRNMIKLHTHNCYRQEIVVNFHANFVKNVNDKIDINLVKGDEFL